MKYKKRIKQGWSTRNTAHKSEAVFFLLFTNTNITIRQTKDETSFAPVFHVPAMSCFWMTSIANGLAETNPTRYKEKPFQTCFLFLTRF